MCSRQRQGQGVEPSKTSSWASPQARRWCPLVGLRPVHRKSKTSALGFLWAQMTDVDVSLGVTYRYRYDRWLLGSELDSTYFLQTGCDRAPHRRPRIGMRTPAGYAMPYARACNWLLRSDTRPTALTGSAAVYMPLTAPYLVAPVPPPQCTAEHIVQVIAVHRTYAALHAEFNSRPTPGVAGRM